MGPTKKTGGLEPSRLQVWLAGRCWPGGAIVVKGPTVGPTKKTGGLEPSRLQVWLTGSCWPGGAIAGGR